MGVSVGVRRCSSPCRLSAPLPRIAGRFGDWQQSLEFMKSSPEFADDPIGKFFDPQKMLDARRAGASEEELHRRAYAGEWYVEYDPRFPL